MNPTEERLARMKAFRTKHNDHPAHCCHSTDRIDARNHLRVVCCCWCGFESSLPSYWHLYLGEHGPYGPDIDAKGPK